MEKKNNDFLATEPVAGLLAGNPTVVAQLTTAINTGRI